MPPTPMDAAATQVLDAAKNQNVKFIQLQFTDLFGVVKCVTIPLAHLPRSLADGTWFDGSSIEGFARIAESDLYLKPDPATFAVLPWLDAPDGHTARVICDVYNADGAPFAGDPRHILKRALAAAAALGYQYNTGPELEFFLFKNDGGLRPLPHDAAGYFDLSPDRAGGIRQEMTNALAAFGIDVEASHHEVARGQHEIDFRYDDALTTADNAVTFKFTLKAVAHRHDLHVTFMPKPLAGINGSGMHVHQSLFDLKSRHNAFHDEQDPYHLSPVAYHFLAGQLAHVKALAAVLAPTVNSYKRLVPGFEAPVFVSWARMNRSALIRVPRIFAGKPESTRLELRCPDPSCNVYLAFAVMLAAGLDGVKRKLAPPEPVEEDIYGLDEDKRTVRKIDMLPYSLWNALKEMKKDPLLRETLGDHTYERYLEAKTREWDEYRVQVTPWELDTYLGS
jgi:glutamine synthetase